MGKRLLIIDDEPDIRDVIQACLEELAHCWVVTAGSGEAGLSQAKSGTWDAILLDVSMPGMDGYAVFEQLQTDPETKAIPVLLLTAKVLPRERGRFAEMGVAGVITKPFDLVTLWDQIATILSWDSQQ